MLGRAVSLATQIAFQPSYIDKPPGALRPHRSSTRISSTLLQMAKSISSLFLAA